jgi:hypothetical protein
MRRLSWSLALIAATLCAASASSLAQSSPPTIDDREIVVEGIKERQRQIRRFVGSLTETHFRGQIGRFEWQVCPVAAGMPESQSRQVTERMRQIAEAAGVPLADPGCAANALVIVTPDKPATMRMLRRSYPDLFRTELDTRIRPDPDEPVSAWQVEGRLTQDGLSVPVAVADMGTYHQSTVTRASSRITPATRPHFKASVLVVQLDALRGLTLTQFADYAAMRLFAKTQPEQVDRTAPTILNIIDAPMGTDVPLTLTAWDLGFLRGLYSSAENHYAEQQRQEIRRLMERDLRIGLAEPD